MPVRFIKKRPQNRYVRPPKNNQFIRTVTVIEKEVAEKTAVNNVVETVEEQKITENSNMDNRIVQINQVLDTKKGTKRASVKVEKKSNGLYEKTEDSKILITEDNKMLLND